MRIASIANSINKPSLNTVSVNGTNLSQGTTRCQLIVQLGCLAEKLPFNGASFITVVCVTGFSLNR